MVPFLPGQLDSGPSSPDERNPDTLLDNVHSIAIQSSKPAHMSGTSGITTDTSQLPAAASGGLIPTSTYETDPYQNTSNMDAASEIEKSVESKERAKVFAAAEKRAVAASARRNELLRTKHLQCVVNSASFPLKLRKAAATMREIVRYWVKSAKDCHEQPLLHAISFGERKGERLTIQLKQVFALFPQKWQGWLHGRYISEWGSESWLDENLMNVLVHLAFPPDREEHVAFGLSLASLINDDVNALYNSDDCTGYLHHLVKNMVPNLPDPEEFKSEVNIFKFPQNIYRIVWFWNHDGMHWVTIKTEISDQCWSHRIYNSMEDNEEVRNWGGRVRAEVTNEIDDLEHIITKVSGFATTSHYATLRKGYTPEQTNTNDCGVFTVYNTLCLLDGREPDIEMTGDRCRADFLNLIFRALWDQFGDLPEEFDDEDLLEVNNPDHTLSRNSEPGSTLKIDPALKHPHSQDSETVWDDWDNAGGSNTASLSSQRNSTNQPQEIIPASLPGTTMATEDFDEDRKFTQPDTVCPVSRSRGPSPDAINLSTPPSSPSASQCHRVQIVRVVDSSSVVDSSRQMAASPNHYMPQIKGNTPSPITNNTNEPGNNNMEMDEPDSTAVLKATNSPPPLIKIIRVISPRSVIFNAQPETTSTEMLRMSRPYTAKRASSPPPIYDATLPLALPFPLNNICTSAPIYNALDLPKIAPISQATGYPHIFPMSKKLTLKEFTKRIADMETLREHGFLTPRHIASWNKLTEDTRERAIKRVAKRCKRASGS